MNILFTSKGRIIVLLLLICQFGLKLTASAAGSKMVCDTDTIATKKAKKSQILQSDTTLVLKAGSTVFRNADTILIINGVPTKLSKKSPAVKPDPNPIMDGGAKADSIAQGFKVSAPSKISTIIQPTEGTIQVKNNPNEQPTNTTIVAPPTDGVIQMRSIGNPAATTTVPAAGGVPAGSNPTSPSTNPATDNNATNPNNSANPPANSVTPPTQDNAAQNPNPAVVKPDTTTEKLDINGNPIPLTSGEIQVKDQNAAGNAGNAGNGNGNVKVLRDTTTILKKDTTTIIKRDTTTILQRDTVTIIKKDTVTITKRDTLTSGQTAEQDTTDFSQVKAKNYYLQVGGAGLAISANYDSRFGAERNGWGYTVGIGGFSSEGNSVITVPFQINFLIGEHSSMFQVGGGATFLRSTGNNTGKTWSFDKITGFVATGSIGYRYQPEQKGLSFKVEFVPILYDEGIIPAGGISIGYTFK